jgi:hypothetical protein
MREPEMFEPMKKFLESKGYKILQMKRGKKVGPDIVAGSNTVGPTIDVLRFQFLD